MPSRIHMKIDTFELPSGVLLNRQPDGVGGMVYTAKDATGGVFVWHTNLVGIEILERAVEEEKKRRGGEEKGNGEVE